MDSLLSFHAERPQSRVLAAQWHSLAGRQAAARGATQAAETQYRRAVERSPETPDVHAQLGEFLLNEGRAREALPALQAYEQRRPDDPRAPLLVGLAQAQLGSFSTAQEKVARARDLAAKAGDTQTVQFCTEILEQLAADAR